MMRSGLNEDNAFDVIDPDELQSLFVEAQQKVSELSGREIVLVVGKTGRGKSTFVNYMSEHPLVLVENPETGDEELQLSNPAMPGAAVIGGLNRGAQTVFPQTHGIFCDTGGFLDTRGLSFEIAIYYALRAALAAAGRVKAVVLIFQEAQLDSDKGGYEIAAAVKAVEGLLGPAKSEYYPSLLIAFNRCRRNRTQLINKLKALRKNLSESGYLLEQEMSDRLSSLLERSDNIQVLNHEDGGESRDIVRQFLSRVNGIGNSYKSHVSGQLRGGPYYGHLRNLSEGVAGRFLALHEVLNRERELRVTLNQEIASLSERITSDERDIERYSSEQVSGSDDALAEVDQDIRRDQGRHDALGREISGLERDNIQLRDAINNLRMDQTKVFAGETEQYDEHKKHGVVNKGVVKEEGHKFFARPGLPIYEVSENGATGGVSEGTSGYFTDKNWNKESYQSKYVGPSHFYGWAQVKFHSLRCETQACKNEISAKEDKIGHNQAQIVSKKGEQATLVDQLNRLRETKRGILADLANTARAMLHDRQQSLEQNQRSLSDKQRQFQECEAKIASAEQQLAANHPKFVMLKRLSQVITGLNEEPCIADFNRLFASVPQQQPTQFFGEAPDVRGRGAAHQARPGSPGH